ncbi:MAG: hypothetical protein DMF98_07920 [Acidobacteria bacterium]|nr:MAG: hypothetical protein DMF98_07920 [Acidobacteriota bacterium]
MPAPHSIALSQPAPVYPRERTRVMFCIDNMQIGGTELNAVRTAERLDRTRFDLSVICLQRDGPLMARYEAAGIPVISLALKNLYGLNAVRQGFRLATLLRQRRVDIFHAHDFYSNIFGITWARLAGTPVVIASRRWWAWPPRRAHRTLNRVASRFADRVLANSRAISEMLAATEGFPPKQVVVIPNFVDDRSVTALTPQQREGLLRGLGVPPTARVIGTVANLSPIKDHVTLLRAVALLTPRWPDLHVVLVGDGPCRSTLQEVVCGLDLGGRVHFAGVRDNGPQLHQLFEVSVLCSLSEGFPNTLIEAMAQGVPVVATDVGGTRDAVCNGTTGLLVPASDPTRLASALDSLLSDPARRRAISVSAQRYVRERFGAASVIGSLEALYTSLVGECRA